MIAAREAAYVREKLLENPGLDVNVFFVGTEVHLTDAGSADYIVKGQDALTGADCDWFWLVRSTPGKPEVVFFRCAYTVRVLGSKSNGYRDIRSDWWSAGGDGYAEIYRFDGVKYVLGQRFDTRRKIKP